MPRALSSLIFFPALSRALTTSASTGSTSRRLRLAVVGDCHGQYNDEDNEALCAIAPDMALFVGDYGNEDVEIVRNIARLQDRLPTASILGNHDTWFLSREIAKALSKKKKKNKKKQKHMHEDAAGGRESTQDEAGTVVAPGARPHLGFTKEYNAVRQMHELLAPSNVAWGRIDHENLALSVVGGRPISSGGESLRTQAAVYEALWGVVGEAESANRIAENVNGAPWPTVLLAHNGPSGLGSEPHDICGRDWGRPAGGDWGDEDLRLALAACPAGKVPLVIFGHMHHQLQGGGERRIVHETSEADGGHPLYVNAACVPRWRVGRSESGGAIERAFTMIDLLTAGAPTQAASSEGAGSAWSVERVELVWALPTGEVTERRELWRA